MRGEGRGWESGVAHLYVFYVSGRVPGGSDFNDAKSRVREGNDAKSPGGSAREDLTRAGGGEGGRGGWGGSGALGSERRSELSGCGII